jgi:hypothetical protein
LNNCSRYNTEGTDAPRQADFTEGRVIVDGVVASPTASMCQYVLVVSHKHASWLYLIEGFFSKLARSALRHIRVASKQELRDRLATAIDNINRDPVVHNWTYKLDEAA